MNELQSLELNQSLKDSMSTLNNQIAPNENIQNQNTKGTEDSNRKVFI